MRISVRYPIAEADRLVLRTAHDWTRDVLPEVQGHGTALFEVPVHGPFLALKPCLWRGDTFHWSKGSDLVLGAHDPDPEIWPFFFSSEKGSVSEVLRFPRGDSAHPGVTTRRSPSTRGDSDHSPPDIMRPEKSPGRLFFPRTFPVAASSAMRSPSVPMA